MDNRLEFQAEFLESEGVMLDDFAEALFTIFLIGVPLIIILGVLLYYLFTFCCRGSAHGFDEEERIDYYYIEDDESYEGEYGLDAAGNASPPYDGPIALSRV